MKNADQSAMPIAMEMNKGYNYMDGLTKREYIAAKAMVGIMTANLEPGIGYIGKEIVAKNAVAFADALLEELEK